MADVSASHHRGRVERLGKQLASLEIQLAGHSERANRDKVAALRASGQASRSSSASTVQSKLRDARRHEEAAAGHERKAADVQSRIAKKRTELLAAQREHARAEEAERKRDAAAAERQRREDIRRIAELERARRAQSPRFAVPSAQQATATRETDDYEYDVCLSFAGEQRPYVEMVARDLRSAGLRCFYDDDEKVKLWGRNLQEEFDRIYRQASRYCVMFISTEYAAKAWTRFERRSALARALVEEGEYVLPARFDDTELPGLPPTTAYLELSETAPATLIQWIIEKVRGSSNEGVEDSADG